MGIESHVPGKVLTSGMDIIVNWARKHSLWPMVFGTACCGIEIMSVLASRYDMGRFGSEFTGFPPRRTDLFIVAGRVQRRELYIMKRIWDQMSEPKWAISMGACASSGGIFDTYSMVQGVDRFIPIDVYIPGCPPKPEDVINALLLLRKKIEKETVKKDQERRMKEVYDPLTDFNPRFPEFRKNG
ncbi:MAG: NADH-quinone oxidoreductase subunit NuoB [Acidobacteria bacterium]|nr:NADH-quinone oxidoreductase subunit NuoB [Acidobacteriota bacterium]